MRQDDGEAMDVDLVAAEYVLGTLDDAQRADFERQLATDPALQRLVGSWEQRLASLDGLESHEEPPPDLWSRIDQAIESDRPEDAITVRQDEGEWLELYPGVTRKTLHANREEGVQSYLLRLMPGARIPTHDHDMAEECYFLEGEVIMGHQRFRPGDFHIALAGSTHQEITSETGALLLIRGELAA